MSLLHNSIPNLSNSSLQELEQQDQTILPSISSLKVTQETQNLPNQSPNIISTFQSANSLFKHPEQAKSTVEKTLISPLKQQNSTPNAKFYKSFKSTENFQQSFSSPNLINPTSAQKSSIPNISDDQYKNQKPLEISKDKLLIPQGAYESPLLQNQLMNPSLEFLQSLIQSSPQFENKNTSTFTTDSYDLSSFLTKIFSQPYLFFNTPSMNIPGLLASADDIYSVFTFIVPSKPTQQVFQNSSKIFNNQINQTQEPPSFLKSSVRKNNSFDMDLEELIKQHSHPEEEIKRRSKDSLVQLQN